MLSVAVQWCVCGGSRWLWGFGCLFTKKHHDSSHVQSVTHTRTSPFPFSAPYKRVAWQICLIFLFNELPEHIAWHLLIWTRKVRLPCQKINLFQIRQPRCAWGWKRGHGLNQRSSRTGTLCQLKRTRMTRGASRLTAAVNRGPRDNRARSVAQSMTPRLPFSGTYLLLPLSEQKMSAGVHTHKNKRLNINTEISDYKFMK